MTADPEPLRLAAFRRFWVAESVSGLGTAITLFALPVFVVVTMGGSSTEVGLLSAARWLPYLLLGLVVGAMVDRLRRKPVLVATDLARGVAFAILPLAWLMGWLSLPLLLAVVFMVGALSLVNDAASQSILPRLVPRSALLNANARIDQSSAVVQTGGPALSGALIGWIGAPLTIALDVVSYLISALLTVRIDLTEPQPEKPAKEPGRLRREIAEGLAWTYRHRTLAPQAISAHGWFLSNSVMMTMLVPYAVLQLGIGPFALGLVMAIAGAGGVIGAFASAWLARKFGVGKAILLCRAMAPIAALVMLLAPDGQPLLATVVLAAAQFVYGLELGASNASEMSYRQAMTPDALQGRMNTTIRSINRAMIVIGAPLGGLLADAIGFRPVLAIAAGGFVLAAVYLAASPFRNASLDDAPDA